MAGDETSSGSAVRHDPQARRFLTRVDGTEGYVEYERDGDTLTITHTIVPPAIGGRGVAATLVRAAADFARESGLKVVPACSYAESWLRRNPDYADLRHPG